MSGNSSTDGRVTCPICGQSNNQFDNECRRCRAALGTVKTKEAPAAERSSVDLLVLECERTWATGTIADLRSCLERAVTVMRAQQNIARLSPEPTAPQALVCALKHADSIDGDSTDALALRLLAEEVRRLSGEPEAISPPSRTETLLRAVVSEMRFGNSISEETLTQAELCVQGFLREPAPSYDGEAHDMVCTVLGWLESDRDVDRAIEILRAARKDHERRFAARQPSTKDGKQV